MAFQEVHVSQFTSPTTPYTGCRHGDGYFATETHSFHCLANENDIQVTAESLPQEQQCVGHDQSGAWELFAFLNQSVNQDEQEQVNASDNHRRTSQSSISALESSLRSMEASSSSLLEGESAPTAQEHNTIAWLVLKSREELAPAFTASLSFRPLTPMITTPLDHHSKDECKVVGWVGSADDSKLRCFIPQRGDHPILKQVELKNDDVFQFDSPVMVMDSLTTQGKNQQQLIAVGCQDGTVRVISFSSRRTGDSLSFTKLVAHTILVDGPIMALHLSQQHHDGTMHLIVGSMCGFVCRLKKTCDGWQGPWMVTEGLWNTSLDSEDAVLAVNKLSSNMVALGTHSGQCFVYQERLGEDDSYRLLWKCQLPYSIHGLSHVHTPAQTSLLVTTRYTFHVFRRDVPKYSAERAKRRVEEMISQRQDAMELLKLA